MKNPGRQSVLQIPGGLKAICWIYAQANASNGKIPNKILVFGFVRALIKKAKLKRFFEIHHVSEVLFRLDNPFSYLHEFKL